MSTGLDNTTFEWSDVKYLSKAQLLEMQEEYERKAAYSGVLYALASAFLGVAIPGSGVIAYICAATGAFSGYAISEAVTIDEDISNIIEDNDVDNGIDVKYWQEVKKLYNPDGSVQSESIRIHKVVAA